MKAIHNADWSVDQTGATVFNISKIQNESNSQRAGYTNVAAVHCVQYFKDTK